MTLSLSGGHKRAASLPARRCPDFFHPARKGYCRPVNCITGTTRGLSYKRQRRPLMGSFGSRKWPLLRAVSLAFLSAASENEGGHVSVARTPAQCDRLCRLPRRCDLSQASQERRRAIGLITSHRRARLYRHTEEHKRSHFALRPDVPADTVASINHLGT